MSLACLTAEWGHVMIEPLIPTQPPLCAVVLLKILILTTLKAIFLRLFLIWTVNWSSSRRGVHVQSSHKLQRPAALGALFLQCMFRMCHMEIMPMMMDETAIAGWWLQWWWWGWCFVEEPHSDGDWRVWVCMCVCCVRVWYSAAFWTDVVNVDNSELMAARDYSKAALPILYWWLT